MLLEGRFWHKFCKPEQIKDSMQKGKVYLYQMYTTIYVEFDTVEEANVFRRWIQTVDEYWDYDPVATIDTNDEETCKRWGVRLNIDETEV